MDWDIVAVVAAGASVFLFVIAVGWDFKFRAVTVEDVHWKDSDLWWVQEQRETALQSAVDRRGRHLRTD